jgi:hypothetical protein
MTEIGRQIGATGGSEVRLADVTEVVKTPDAYRLRLALNAVYPGANQAIPARCSANAKGVRDISFG